MRRLTLAAALASLLATACQGSKGPQGDPGQNGTAAVDKGTISGTVKDGAGAPIVGATVSTLPATTPQVTDATGHYTVTAIPIGVYSVTASKTGFTDGSLASVGVTAGWDTTANLTLAPPAFAAGAISGKVVDTAGIARAGVTVVAVGTDVTAVTDASGAYTLPAMPGGQFFFVETQATADQKWLAGGTRSSVGVFAASNAAPDIVVSARPTDAATYVGGAACTGCHSSFMSSVTASAHARSLTTPVTASDATALQRLVTVPGPANALWPASPTTSGNKLSFTVLCPDGVATCNAYACNLSNLATAPAARSYGFKFVPVPGSGSNPTNTDCTVTTDGVVVPISGTYGGEGDRYVKPGTSTELKNTGVYKQRFFAALADVPATAGWSDYPAADQARDWAVFPIQITQPGGQVDATGAVVNGGARFAAYGALQNVWSKRGKTFAQQCASCHNVGLTLSFNASGQVTAYNYADFNISCEHCHGPGSEHASAGGGKATAIINPAGLTAAGEVQVCGKCHAADAATMKAPFGAGEMPWNQDRAGTIGSGNFVAGIHDITDYIANYNGEVELNGVILEPGFVAWADGKHGQPHRQQGYELEHSLHMNNSYERVTCSDCHSVHSAYQGPFSAKSTDAVTHDAYDFRGTKFKNNTVCLRCHANFGSFASFSKDDVAALLTGAGGSAFVNGAGTAKTYTAAQIQAATQKVADAVVIHMNDKAGMGLQVTYQPENDATPVGRCSSCHMAQTGKSGGYTFIQNAAGKRAMISGDESSHRFDVVYPADAYTTYLISQALAPPASGADNRYQSTMPNACATCHDTARYYIQ